MAQVFRARACDGVEGIYTRHASGAVKKHGLEAPTAWFRQTQLTGSDLLLDYGDHFSFWLKPSSHSVEIYLRSDQPQPYLDVYLRTQLAGLKLTVEGREPLHGTVLTWRQKTFAFLGESGAGKSTWAAHLIAQGAELLSDDLLLYREGFVQAILPTFLKLFPAEWKRFLPQWTPVATMNGQTSKLIFKVEPTPGEYKLDGIFVLGNADASAAVRRLTPLQAYLSAVENVYATIWWPSQRLRSQFTQLSHLSNRVPFYLLNYPRRFTFDSELLFKTLESPGVTRRDPEKVVHT